jgi:hypothetical protein
LIVFAVTNTKAVSLSLSKAIAENAYIHRFRQAQPDNIYFLHQRYNQKQAAINLRQWLLSKKGI